MTVVFPGEPYQSHCVDTAFEVEAEAAKAADFSCAFLNFEALTDDGDFAEAVRRIPASETLSPAVYRGWMLTPEQYAHLYEALSAKNLFLLNTPSAYRHCHYLPENYPVIAAVTPETVSLPFGPDSIIEAVFPLLERFGSRPLVLKDYVKSQKHYWKESCFIPNASDHESVRRVVTCFLQLQGDSLAEGLVFREFVELKPLGGHPKSGMPLTREFRRFFLDGVPLATARYWDEADYGSSAANDEPPINLFGDIAKEVQSRFFTMDIAQRINGEWLIVELSDAQVSGLPESLTITALYERLSQGFSS